MTPALRFYHRCFGALCALCLLLLGLAQPARASHIRAGDIQAKTDTTAAHNPLRIFFKMVTYTAVVPADDPNNPSSNQAVIFFGDGTSTTATRLPPVIIGNSMRRSVYYFEHTYNGPGSFDVSYIGELRATGIRNVPLSDSRSFYIRTRISIDPTRGLNRSPVLRHPAIDRAASGRVFEHNPAAFDADGDSLAFKLLVCQYEPRSVNDIVATNNRPNPQDIPGYTFPQVASGGLQVPYAGPPAGDPTQPSRLDLDLNRGQMVWNAPNQLGDYNVAFKVEEWRRDAFGARIKIGEVVRDMQITVFASTNNPPVLVIPQDTCVVAGTLLERNVRATDADGDRIILTAYGGMLPPATFVQTSGAAGRATGRFRWLTSCADVASDPHIIVFKAEDQPSGGINLTTLRPWRVTVVGPAPTGLRTTLAGNTVRLNWDAYFCQNATRIHIYRKENPSGWSPGTCETGIPASAGYTEISSVAANLTTYLDDNAGRGLARGKTYCYRIYAEFPRPAGGASLASAETCVTLPGRALLLRNVTVDRTDATNGQLTVRWTRPAPAAAFQGPLGYRLYRADGQNPSQFLPVRTFNSATDTVHVDTNLDTENKAYTYRVEFFYRAVVGGPEVVETAETASSVWTTATANPGRTPTISVSWTFRTPWNNAGNRTEVYRRDLSSSTFTRLTSTATSTRTGGSYLDNDPALRLNGQYCYYVVTHGDYDTPTQPQNLVNSSQERCLVLAQLPCRPVLSLQGPDCDRLAEQARIYPSPLPRPLTYTNTLRWQLSDRPEGCNARIREYRVLYSANCDSTGFQEIGRTGGTSFVHSGLISAAGCYRVLAVDSAGTTAASNIVSGDNCRLFVLPNVFTPNNDGANDTFRPLFASPVQQVQVRIFNRWGTQVYAGRAGSDLTLWNGGGATRPESGGYDTGAKASAGTYYYQIDVEFADRQHTRQSFKGWVEIMR